MQHSKPYTVSIEFRSGGGICYEFRDARAAREKYTDLLAKYLDARIYMNTHHEG